MLPMVLCITKKTCKSFEIRVGQSFDSGLNISSIVGLRGHHSIVQEGGGAVVFVADKLFISNLLGSALNNLNFITCLYSS